MRSFIHPARGLIAGSALMGLLCACSSGGSTPVTPVTAQTSAPAASSAKKAAIVFTMHWTSAPTAAVRGRRYVPASARSVSVAVDGGTPQYLNNPSPTLTIAADPGVDTFFFQIYDEQNGQGNVLSRASVTQTVVAGTDNFVTATLNGVIASVVVSLDDAKPSAGTPATVKVNLAAKDADGNTIVGAGDYNTPIQLSISDPSNSGTLSISPTTIPNPSTTATLTYSGGTLASATVVASAAGLPTATAPFAPTPTFYQFSIPTTTNRPQWIAQGSDGNMWFTESPGGAVAKITPAGAITEYPVPTANAAPQMIIGASDGNLWFTELSTTPSPGTNKIAKLTTAGAFTEYSTLFAPPPSDDPLGLVDRGDGTIWYVANGSSRVGYQGIANGVAGETSIPTSNSGPFGIASAPDNNLYYTESATDKIGRVANIFTTQTEISLTPGTVPESIVRGPDGNLWFTENGAGKIGRLAPSSFSVTDEFPTLTANAAPVGICIGADGALWFTENGLDRIGRITTGGTVTEYPSPVTGLGLRGIATGPDGALWFAEPGTGLNPGRIGKLVY